MSDKPVILVTNDDSVNAPGIHALVEAVQPLGEVIVVAPEKPQSAMGHAITMHVPLRMNQIDFSNGVTAYQCSGTPVDCVKLARDKILYRLPDICVSGINHGANHSINVIYSGTMSAAMEAAIEGISSIGFSLLDYTFDADFSLAKKIAFQLTKKLLDNPERNGTLLNVNIPKIEEKNFKGIRICRQARGKWVEKFDERKDPRGRTYFWLTGGFHSQEIERDTDVWALKNNYASIVPVQYDLTDYPLKKKLEKRWKLNN